MVARSPGQRAGLTYEAVLAAARELLAEQGLTGVTMRALAHRLEVAPNTLYSHVPGKTELIDALLDDALAAVEEPRSDIADPVAGLRIVMSSTYDVLLRRPDLVPSYLVRQGARGPHAVRLGRTVDALLARAGVADETVPGARRVLIVHAIGSAAFASGGDGQPLPPAVSRAGFDAGLRWLLAGIVADR